MAEKNNNIVITMKQGKQKATLEGETAFAYAFKRTDDDNIIFTQNQSGMWSKYEVCCAFEALQKSLCISDDGIKVFLDGLNMYLYELQDMLKDKGETAPRVKVMVGENTVLQEEEPKSEEPVT